MCKAFHAHNCTNKPVTSAVCDIWSHFGRITPGHAVPLSRVGVVWKLANSQKEKKNVFMVRQAGTQGRTQMQSSLREEAPLTHQWPQNRGTNQTGYASFLEDPVQGLRRGRLMGNRWRWSVIRADTHVTQVVWMREEWVSYQNKSMKWAQTRQTSSRCDNLEQDFFFSININAGLWLCPRFKLWPRCVFEFDAPAHKGQGEESGPRAH